MRSTENYSSPSNLSLTPQKFEYKIVDEHSCSRYQAIEALEKRVNELLAKGWQLQGGVSISVSQHGYTDYFTFAQALIKY